MRIFLVFMFSLFLFGCGDDRKHPESLSEIIKYQVGDKITDKEIEEIGFSEESIDMDDNKEFFMYNLRDANSVNTPFWLDMLIVSNDKIQAAVFKFNLFGTEEALDKYIAELRAYIKEEFDVELELMDAPGAAGMYFADIEGSKGVGKILLTIKETELDESNIFFDGTVGFLTEEVALKIGL